MGFSKSTKPDNQMQANHESRKFSTLAFSKTWKGEQIKFSSNSVLVSETNKRKVEAYGRGNGKGERDMRSGHLTDKEKIAERPSRE